MAILDNRTALSGFETTDTPAAPDDLTGGVGGTADTEIFIEGSRSFGYYSGSTRDGLMYDAGAAQDWSDNTFYIWINCGVAGLLDTVANGGMAVRFAGNTVSDWFEVNVAGSNGYPAAVSGGWVMLVVDIEKAKTASHRTSGTPPATTAIRYVGVTTICTSMPRMADNTWLDKIWRLPASTPGILVEGRAGGPTDYTWADIATASETGAWGTAKVVAGGAIAINTPIRFGANDAVQHGFADTNAVVLWEDWDVATSFYGLEVIGGSGIQAFTLGEVSGTGDASTGAQGGVIAAAGTGERWYFDCDDANIDLCGIYGVTMLHSGAFDFDEGFTEVVGSVLADGDSADITGVGLFVRNQIVNANTADGVAYLTTDDLSDVDFCTFVFSDGHAVEITSGGPATQTSKGNTFGAYGITTSNDAAVYNNSAAARTISVLDGGDAPTYRDGASASTTVEESVTAQITVQDKANAAIQNAQCSIYLTADDSEVMNTDSNASGVASATFGGTTPADIYWRVRKGSPGDTKYIAQSGVGTIAAGSGFAVTVTLSVNPNNNA